MINDKKQSHIFQQQMQKIHRRKNEQIPKDYVCAEGCGKAYGSYAALYTHMKNKHGCLKVADVKAPSIKVKSSGKKGRPLIKVKEQVLVSNPIINQNACKLCYEEQCICDSDINSEDIDKNIAIMSDRIYLKLLNSIGHLNVGEHFTWIRSTEQDYKLITKQQLKQMAEEFNLKNNFKNELYLSDRWLEYLSHLSKFLDSDYSSELFEVIFLIICRQNLADPAKFRSGSQELTNAKQCSEQKRKEWKQFVEIVLMI